MRGKASSEMDRNDGQFHVQSRPALIGLNLKPAAKLLPPVRSWSCGISKLTRSAAFGNSPTHSQRIAGGTWQFLPLGWQRDAEGWANLLLGRDHRHGAYLACLGEHFPFRLSEWRKDHGLAELGRIQGTYSPLVSLSCNG